MSDKANEFRKEITAALLANGEEFSVDQWNAVSNRVIEAARAEAERQIAATVKAERERAAGIVRSNIGDYDEDTIDRSEVEEMLKATAKQILEGE